MTQLYFDWYRIPSGPMSSDTATRKQRTTCEECGLPYYGSETDTCPYCDRAAGGVRADSSSVATARDDDSSVFERLSNRIRAVLG